MRLAITLDEKPHDTVKREDLSLGRQWPGERRVSRVSLDAGEEAEWLARQLQARPGWYARDSPDAQAAERVAQQTAEAARNRATRRATSQEWYRKEARETDTVVTVATDSGARAYLTVPATSTIRDLEYVVGLWRATGMEGEAHEGRVRVFPRHRGAAPAASSVLVRAACAGRPAFFWARRVPRFMDGGEDEYRGDGGGVKVLLPAGDVSRAREHDAREAERAKALAQRCARHEERLALAEVVAREKEELARRNAVTEAREAEPREDGGRRRRPRARAA